MSILGSFASSVGGMMAQSKKMQSISLNIANLNTGGYKRLDTNFSTLLSQSYGHNNDIGGVRGITRTMISQQGNIQSSDSNLDVAINGGGFFMLNSQLDGSGTSYYGRDGSLSTALGPEITVISNGVSSTSNEGYLVDKNGYYVQGWPVNSDQKTFPTDQSSLQSIRIDPEAFTANGEATTTATLGLNLPSDAPPNYNESTFISAYDSSGVLKTYQMKFTNLILGQGTTTASPTWNLPSAAAVAYTETNSITVRNTEGFDQDLNLKWTKTGADTWDLEVLEGSTALDVDGTLDGTANPISVTFDPLSVPAGAIITPTSLNVASLQTKGATFALDLATITQANLGAAITQTSFTENGVGASQLANNWTVEISEAGSALTIDTDATPTKLQLTFDSGAALTNPLTINVPGAGGTFSLDISKMTNYASGQIVEGSYEYNGRSDARLVGMEFNQKGEIIGRFSDSTQRPIYKLPLATFVNPDGLEAVNGNVYLHDPLAGDMTVRTANGQGAGVFVPNARELSNVDMADEFSKMIVTQNAYNTASTAFKTIDEMTEVVRDLA